VFLAGYVLAVACGSRDATPRENARPATTVATDARVDPAAQAACAFGESLLRTAPHAAVQITAAVPTDSVWYGETPRWFCRVTASGHSKHGWLSVDTVMRAFVARGWSDRTMVSADGPDGTVQGVHRAGVTCVVEGRWDGGDDSDTTYVPSDTIEVRLACTRTVTADTLMPEFKPSTIPAKPLTGTIVRP
jgi:hypothetical protein